MNGFKGVVRSLIMHLILVAHMPGKTPLLTQSKTDQYSPIYGQPIAQFCPFPETVLWSKSSSLGKLETVPPSDIMMVSFILLQHLPNRFAGFK